MQLDQIIANISRCNENEESDRLKLQLLIIRLQYQLSEMSIVQIIYALYATVRLQASNGVQIQLFSELRKKTGKSLSNDIEEWTGWFLHVAGTCYDYDKKIVRKLFTIWRTERIALERLNRFHRGPHQMR